MTILTRRHFLLTSSVALGPVRQLFGCREGLEQQMYSAVRDEVDRRLRLLEVTAPAPG